MFGSLPSACVPCSWDAEFAQYRRNFYPPAENKTPEEDLHEIAIASGYAQAEPRIGGEHGANPSSNPVVDTVAAFMQSSIGCSNGPNSLYQTEVVTGFCGHPGSDLLRVRRGKGFPVTGERLVALVYEWENKPSQLRQRGPVAAPLTHEQLLVKLCAKVRSIRPLGSMFIKKCIPKRGHSDLLSQSYPPIQDPSQKRAMG